VVGRAELARTAFERAAAAGNGSALIRLAQHRWVVLEDYGGALPLYQQAIASPDPGVAAEALTGLGQAHRAHGDYQAARGVLEDCIAAGHPDWAPQAMMMLGGMLEYQLRDYEGARAMFQAAIGTGHPESGPEAMFLLGHLLQRTGAALAAGNRWAPYALVVTGRVLKDRGDPGGWRDAWQQAIGAGYEDAEDLLEELSPPADDDEPAGVPPGLDQRNMARTGIAVLENGLPSLPEPLTRRMAIPMAYWAARETAVVLFLRFHRHRRTWHPAALMVTFTRQDGEWEPGTHWHGTSFTTRSPIPAASTVSTGAPSPPAEDPVTSSATAPRPPP
jgi:tetratricopeptide (TPR) repeat protein